VENTVAVLAPAVCRSKALVERLEGGPVPGDGVSSLLDSTLEGRP
jgi:hypothetical protein